MQQRPSWCARLLGVFLAVAVVCSGALFSAPSKAQAGSRTIQLFRAEFGRAKGPITSTVPVELGKVTPLSGTVTIDKGLDGNALAIIGDSGPAGALLQWKNYPNALPISTTEELQVRVIADFSADSTKGGASFGLYKGTGQISGTQPLTGTQPVTGTESFEFFTFGPSGALTRDGAPLLAYKADSRVHLDAKVVLKKGSGRVQINLATNGGFQTLTVPLPKTFTLKTLNQLFFQTKAGSGVTLIDKVQVRLDRSVNDAPPAVIIIRDGDIEHEIERIGGVIFINIKITIVNTGGRAKGVYLVIDMDAFKDCDLDDIAFLKSIGYVERIEGGLVFIGLGKNNVLEGDPLQLKIKFKLKPSKLDIKIKGGMKLQFQDSLGGHDLDLPLVVDMPAAGTPPPAPLPVAVVRLPVTAIDVRLRGEWQRRGGLLIFGLPLTQPISQSNGLIVQYFERMRLEIHPELRGTPFYIQYGLLAVELGYTRPPTNTTVPTSTAERVWFFPVTGHLIATPFRGFWRARGGLALFGMPITAVIIENGFQVQYFERVRLELHPELRGTPYEVQIGLLGEQALRQRSSQ